MQLVAVDILGPLPESQDGNSYILVVADYFTRWAEAFPIPKHPPWPTCLQTNSSFGFHLQSDSTRIRGNNSSRSFWQKCVRLWESLNQEPPRTIPNAMELSNALIALCLICWQQLLHSILLSGKITCDLFAWHTIPAFIQPQATLHSF